MASPQADNQFTRISNELLEKIMGFQFNATQYKIILTCIRYTYGFQRKEAKLSITYISNAIKISRRYVSKELNALIRMNVITEIKAPSISNTRVMKFNKDYENWYRTTVPQGTIERDEQQQDTTGEQLFHTTGEQLFHQERKKERKNKESDILELESELEQSTDNNISDVNNLINTKKVTALAISQFYESIWELYPIKKGKASVKDSQKKKLYTYGFEEIKRCIERYKKDKEEWRAFKDGSTFFNSGYVDYLDENYNKKTTKESKTPTQLQYDDFDIMTGKPI